VIIHLIGNLKIVKVETVFKNLNVLEKPYCRDISFRKTRKIRSLGTVLETSSHTAEPTEKELQILEIRLTRQVSEILKYLEYSKLKEEVMSPLCVYGYNTHKTVCSNTKNAMRVKI